MVQSGTEVVQIYLVKVGTLHARNATLTEKELTLGYAWNVAKSSNNIHQNKYYAKDVTQSKNDKRKMHIMVRGNERQERMERLTIQ